MTRTNPHFTIRRSTIASRMRATLKAIRHDLMKHRHAPISETGAWLARVVQGCLNYHAVPGNLKRLGMYRAEVCRAWLHSLRRRNQRGRMTWDQFQRYVGDTSRKSAPVIRIQLQGTRHDPRQEPYAVAPHVRI